MGTINLKTQYDRAQAQLIAAIGERSRAFIAWQQSDYARAGAAHDRYIEAVARAEKAQQMLEMWRGYLEAGDNG